MGSAAALLLGVCAMTFAAEIVRAQTTAPATSPTWDLLVDGDLPQDDPAGRRFRTLQGAYAAAMPGTAERPTVIGLRPNVYKLPGGARGASLSITKDNLTLVGLTDDRRTVVLADDRGHAQGADDNGFVLDVNANGFTLRNLTLLNHCNVDYAYPGDASKNLAKRSGVITQAVALQAAGDRHVYDNVAILSRLDTMFLRTTRSYFRNVRIEGTDDFVGGGQVSVWEDCTIAFPMGRGVMAAGNIAFRRCTFEATNGLQFYKADHGSGSGRPVALIECRLPTASSDAPVAWVRGRPATRPSHPSLLYRTTDARGQPALLYDATLDTDGRAYTRELSDREALAFNPWNLLRAAPNGTVDDWDPAAARSEFGAAGDEVFRIALTGAPATIRTGGPSVTLSAKALPARVADAPIKWSTTSDAVTLGEAGDGSVVVTGHNTGEIVQQVPVIATAPNGARATAWVLVEPAYVEPPAVKVAPTIEGPSNGAVSVRYALDLGGREDRSIVTWSLCDDAAGANARDVAVSRGDEPFRTLPLPPGAVGKHVRVTVQPKHTISEPGPALVAISKAPIATADVRSQDVAPNFRNFVVAPTADVVNGLFGVAGTWTVETGERFTNGYGVRAASVGASLLYPRESPCGDMRVDLFLTPEKTDGQGFGGPGSSDDAPTAQRADVYIKYDPRTRNGYALRFWRTTQSAERCTFQLFKIENGVGSPLNDQQVSSGAFKPSTRMSLAVVGDRLTVEATNTADDEKLSLTGTIVPNDFGGAGLYWAGSVPRGNSVVVSQFAITYPDRK